MITLILPLPRESSTKGESDVPALSIPHYQESYRRHGFIGYL
jgi:hypothetical protein